MADDDTSAAEAPEAAAQADPWVVCAPLVRARTATPDGIQWRDFREFAHLPGDVDEDHVAMLERKGLIRRASAPLPTGARAWPGSAGAVPGGDPQAAQREVVDALDKAGEVRVSAARSRRGSGSRGRHSGAGAAKTAAPAGSSDDGAQDDDSSGDSGD